MGGLDFSLCMAISALGTSEKGKKFHQGSTALQVVCWVLGVSFHLPDVTSVLGGTGSPILQIWKLSPLPKNAGQINR